MQDSRKIWLLYLKKKEYEINYLFLSCRLQQRNIILLLRIKLTLPIQTPVNNPAGRYSRWSKECHCGFRYQVSHYTCSIRLFPLFAVHGKEYFVTVGIRMRTLIKRKGYPYNLLEITENAIYHKAPLFRERLVHCRQEITC